MPAFDRTGLDVSVLQDRAQAARTQNAARGLGKAGGFGGAGGGGVGGVGGPQNKTAARAAAEEFEALFIAQMLQPMFKDVNMSGLGEKSAGQDIFKGMLVEEYGKAISRAGGVGIADEVQQEILKLQEVGKK